MRKFTLLIFNLIIGTSLFGQISVGITGGTSFSSIKQKIDYSGNPDMQKPDKIEQKITLGLVIGIPVEIKLSDKLGIYTALTYYQKGTKTESIYDDPDIYIKSEGKLTLNYFELPVQGKLYLLKKAMNAYILFGPSFGYAINGRANYEIDIHDINDVDVHESLDEKLKSKDLHDAGLNRLDISLALGGGLSYKVGIGDVFFNVNYTHGLTNMINDDPEVNKGVEQYNRSLSTTVGYLISLSK